MNKLHKYLEDETPEDSEKNADIFSMMIQVLDDKSLNLIIRDAPDKGRESFKILKEHYLGTSWEVLTSTSWEATPRAPWGSRLRPGGRRTASRATHVGTAGRRRVEGRQQGEYDAVLVL